MALKTMSIAKLQDLKGKVEATISAKVSERRRELESELAKLTGFGGGGKATKLGKSGRMGPVAPKYRNLGRPWPQAAVVGRRHQKRQEAGGFCYSRPQGVGGEATQEDHAMRCLRVTFTSRRSARVETHR